MGIPINKPVSWELFGLVAELCIAFSTLENRRLVPKNGAVEDDIPFQSGHCSGFPCHFFLANIQKWLQPFATSTWQIRVTVFH